MNPFENDTKGLINHIKSVHTGEIIIRKTYVSVSITTKDFYN